MRKKQAIEALDNLIGMVDDSNDTDYGKALHMAIDALSKHKTGRWTKVGICHDYDGEWRTSPMLRCSACRRIDVRMNQSDNYCPNCGARMIEGEQE